MGSLTDGLRRREVAAWAEADRLRARAEALAEQLAGAEEQVARLVIAREQVSRVRAEPADADLPGGEPAGESRSASPIGAVTVPPTGPYTDENGRPMLIGGGRQTLATHATSSAQAVRA